MTKKPRRQAYGLTLMELMTVMVIVALLAVIAYPSFMESVRKSRRTDATIALGDLASRMDRYYTENNTFATATIATGNATTDVLATTQTPEGNYTLSIVSQTATTFSIRATAQGTQTGDTYCGDFTLTNTGARSVSGTQTVDYCW